MPKRLLKSQRHRISVRIIVQSVAEKAKTAGFRRSSRAIEREIEAECHIEGLTRYPRTGSSSTISATRPAFASALQLQVLGKSLEFSKGAFRRHAAVGHGIGNTMFHVIMDQRALG